MDKKVMNNLFNIACVGLTVAGIIFLCVRLFGGEEYEDCLLGSLLCVSLAMLFNAVRNLLKKE